jgi:hypothetical protein
MEVESERGTAALRLDAASSQKRLPEFLRTVGGVDVGSFGQRASHGVQALRNLASVDTLRVLLNANRCLDPSSEWLAQQLAGVLRQSGNDRLLKLRACRLSVDQRNRHQILFDYVGLGNGCSKQLAGKVGDSSAPFDAAG